MKFEDYTIDEHIHRFAVWTAARAASVSRFSNTEIEQFISESKLREEVKIIRSNSSYSKEEYKTWFVAQVTNVLNFMNAYTQPKGKKRKISFGIAAKVVSIYIKTVEVIPTKGESILSKFAFPPIDSILLKTIKELKDVDVKRTTWSEMDENTFMETLDILIGVMGNNSYWSLEYYWIIKNDKDAESTNV